ncbi:unnamed protein product [Rotaria sordida]|uniref:Activin types I and II receptor domain-containing protein n=2 Tax=Rotaria sordida TaxID=392033 RepID=A0A815SRT5_9BILA|nr:unnamed protein product [Rotaria sordida]CAF1492397.1 unnamed protein product [Rotaria sordida]
MFTFIQFIFISFIFIALQVSTQNQFKESIKCFLRYEHLQHTSQTLNKTLTYTYHQSELTIYRTEENKLCSKVGCACFSYRSVCSHSSRGLNHRAECTNDDKQNGIIQWHRGWTSQAKCEQMRQKPKIYLNLTCCHTDQCNNQPGIIVNIVDRHTPLQIQNTDDDDQTPSSLFITHKPPQQYNNYDHQSSPLLSISHKPSQWNNNYVHHSPTFHLPDNNKPSQVYDNHVHHLTITRLPDTNKPSPVYDSHVRHSMTPRLPVSNKSLQRNHSYVLNSSTSRLPTTHQSTPAYKESLPQNNTIVSSSLSSWMFFFSLVFYFCFMIQLY